MTRIRLGRILKIRHGYAFPGAGFGRDPMLPQVLTPGNFSSGERFKFNAKSFEGSVPEGYCLDAGDLVISMTDLSKRVDTLGLSSVVPEGGRYLHNQRIGLVELLESSALALGYLHYATRTASYRNYVVGTATGTTVRHTSPGRLEAYEMEIPDLGVQEGVVSVLGALDDKIAANRNMNSLALRLLGAEYSSIAKERTGVTFEDVAAIGGGATPSTKVAELWGQGVPWATPTDITGLEGIWLDRTERTISPVGLDSISSPLYPVGSIAMTSRATIGACALLGEPAAVNQGFIVLQPRDDSMRIWLYCQLLARVEELKAWANGATFLELPKKIFRGLLVELGSENAMRDFAKLSEPLVERMHALQRESALLAATRDELLPLLMSGKITVKDAEKTIEEVI